MRAQLLYGSDYYENANDQIVSLAMIETKEAVDNIDEILSVPNLTGVYIGPGDMCSSYGMKPQFDVKKDPIYSNIRMIANKAKQNGNPRKPKENQAANPTVKSGSRGPGVTS